MITIRSGNADIFYPWRGWKCNIFIHPQGEQRPPGTPGVLDLRI